jgi:hypothetical protein
MRMTSRDNLAQVMQDIDRFASDIQAVAVPRALNALRDQAQTAGLREIAKVYEIGPRTMERYVTVKPATGADPQAEISVKGKGFPLNVFKPVRTQTGVSVSIKGRRFTVPHAFVVAKFGGNVFARGSYGGKYGGQASGESFGRFLFGRSRLPISKLYSFSPPDTLANRQVQDVMDDRVAEQAGKVLAREIASARRGF